MLSLFHFIEFVDSKNCLRPFRAPGVGRNALLWSFTPRKSKTSQYCRCLLRFPGSNYS